MKYLLRLDDACEYIDVEKWIRVENMCDAFNVKPIVGVIPQCRDPKLMAAFKYTDFVWNAVHRYMEKGYTLALHGFQHVFETVEGGMNPVNNRSEYAGLPLAIQKQKIINGLRILSEHDIYPRIFFAPAHTFDENTLIALKECSDIRIISDTVANDCYKQGEFLFIPQQSGKVRNVRFQTTTFCYHPNSMKDADFVELEAFLCKNHAKFTCVEQLKFETRGLSVYDKLLRTLYFLKRMRK